MMMIKQTVLDLRVITIYLLRSSYSTCHCLSLVNVEQSCHPKISYLRMELCVEENISCFKVTVDDPKPRFLVEVKESSSSSTNNFAAGFPQEMFTLNRICFP